MSHSVVMRFSKESKFVIKAKSNSHSGGEEFKRWMAKRLTLRQNNCLFWRSLYFFAFRVLMSGTHLSNEIYDAVLFQSEKLEICNFHHRADNFVPINRKTRWISFRNFQIKQSLFVDKRIRTQSVDEPVLALSVTNFVKDLHKQICRGFKNIPIITGWVMLFSSYATVENVKKAFTEKMGYLSNVKVEIIIEQKAKRSINEDDESSIITIKQTIMNKMIFEKEEREKQKREADKLMRENQKMTVFPCAKSANLDDPFDFGEGNNKEVDANDPSAIRKMVIVVGVHNGNMVESIDLPFARWMATFVFRQPFIHHNSFTYEVFEKSPEFIEMLENVKLLQIMGRCERGANDAGETVIIDSLIKNSSLNEIQQNNFSFALLSQSLSDKIECIINKRSFSI